MKDDTSNLSIRTCNSKRSQDIAIGGCLGTG